MEMEEPFVNIDVERNQRGLIMANRDDQYSLEDVTIMQTELKFYGRYSEQFGMYFPIGMCIACAGVGHKPCSKICPTPKSKYGGRQRNNVKAARFTFWLENNFPQFEAMKYSDSIVLDVAGGAGALSTFLQLSYRIRSVIIDPRGYTISDKQQRFFNKQLIDNPHSTPPEFPEQLQIFFKDDWFDDEEHSALWERAGIVVGLHPDEATERIVKLAHETKKPFAVVPCCVFSKTFVNRYLEDGRFVTHHHELCEYLMEKYPGTQKSTINIEGRNTVLYKFGYED